MMQISAKSLSRVTGSLKKITPRAAMRAVPSPHQTAFNVDLPQSEAEEVEGARNSTKSQKDAP